LITILYTYTNLELFPDVVTAYKGLIKEKEALEASLKALTISSTCDKSYESGSKTSSNRTQNEETSSTASTSEVEVINKSSVHKKSHDFC
jgi:hypothetical protein